MLLQPLQRDARVMRSKVSILLRTLLHVAVDGGILAFSYEVVLTTKRGAKYFLTQLDKCGVVRHRLGQLGLLDWKRANEDECLVLFIYSAKCNISVFL